MKKIATKIFAIFLIIQPLLDLQILYEDKNQIFTFSISTIIRLLMTIILFTITYILNKKTSDNKKLFIYKILIIIYSIFHIYNCNNFNANVTSTFNFSFINEIYYLFRMSLPLLLIYITKNSDIDNNQIKKIFLTNIFAYSFVILISSLFTFGYQAYGNGKITYGLLDWFTNNDVTTINSGTKGLFAGTNRTSVLLSALLVITYYYYYKENGNKLSVLLIIQIIASILLCTRVGTYTWIAISIIMLLLYIIFNYKKISIKKILYSILIILLCIPLVIISPIKNRVYGSDMEENFNNIYDENAYDSKLEQFNTEKYTSSKDPEYQEKINFIKEEYLKFNLRPLYIEEIYNYKSDPNFWIDIMKMPYNQRDDDRKIQQYISKRIHHLNNNKLDKYLGVGHSTFKSSDVYLESDILVHFYTIGIIGIIIFFAPYIITIGYSAIFILKNIKKHATFKLISLNFSLCVLLFGSIITGHVLDEMITYVFIALIIGLIFKHIEEIKKTKQDIIPEKVSVIVPIYNVEEYLDECLESILNQDYPKELIETILIDDCSKDRSKEIAKKYVNKYKNIKLIENKVNKGQAISRNTALKYVTSKYIIFLDSDDILYPDCIKKLHQEIVKTKSDIVAARINSYDTKGEYGYYSDKYINEYITSDIYGNKKLVNCISICSKIYKTETIKNIKFLENTIHEDNSFTLISLFKAKKITTLPKYLYKRRIREGENKSIMQKLNYKTYTDLIKNYNFTLKNIKDNKNKTFLHLYMIRKLNNEIGKHVEEEHIQSAHQEIITFINNLEVSNTIKRIYYIYNNVYKKIVQTYLTLRGKKYETKKD